MKLKTGINDMKKWIILILITVISFWILNNLTIVVGIISTIIDVLYPFILGGCIAFILNIPMTNIEKVLKKSLKTKQKLARVLAIIISLLLFILIIAFVAFLLIPELVESIKLLINNIPDLMDKGEVFILDLLDRYPDIQLEIKNMFANSSNISSIIPNILNYFVNGAINFISNFVSGSISTFTAIVFSIYMLMQKEYLIKMTKKIVYAYFSSEKADNLVRIGSMANKTFHKFISGQCLEAIILGVILFGVSQVFRFPYALLIAVLTTITALIPIFGALIAMVVGTILIGITNPLQALVFILVFLVVQQVEENLVYPRVVGKSVGLTPMWTLFAITVGGSLFGIIGMIISLPLASIIYTLLKENINKKLKTKKIEVN